MSSFEKTTFWKEYEISCFNEQSTEILYNFKIDKNLSLLAQWLLEVDNNLNDDERNALKDFFNSVLDKDQKRRDISVENLFKTYVLSFKSKIVF
jgi:hypothetical protein